MHKNDHGQKFMLMSITAEAKLEPKEFLSKTSRGSFCLIYIYILCTYAIHVHMCLILLGFCFQFQFDIMCIILRCFLRLLRKSIHAFTDILLFVSIFTIHYISATSCQLWCVQPAAVIGY